MRPIFSLPRQTATPNFTAFFFCFFFKHCVDNSVGKWILSMCACVIDESKERNWFFAIFSFTKQLFFAFYYFLSFFVKHCVDNYFIFYACVYTIDRN